MRLDCSSWSIFVEQHKVQASFSGGIYIGSNDVKRHCRNAIQGSSSTGEPGVLGGNLNITRSALPVENNGETHVIRCYDTHIELTSKHLAPCKARTNEVGHVLLHRCSLRYNLILGNPSGAWMQPCCFGHWILTCLSWKMLEMVVFLLLFGCPVFPKPLNVAGNHPALRKQRRFSTPAAAPNMSHMQIDSGPKGIHSASQCY